MTMLGAGLAGTQFLLSPGIAWAAQHDHTLNLPVSIGPLVLRVGLLVAVPAVAAFAMLRGFLSEPSRRTAAVVAGSAATAVLFEFMLADGMDFPRQVVVLVLAALAAPLVVILSRDPRHAAARGRARACAPWMVTLSAGFALVEFVRAVLGAGELTVLLPTAVVLALVGLSWFTVCGVRGRVTGPLVLIEAALLGNAVLAASAYALMLTLPRLTAAAP